MAHKWWFSLTSLWFAVFSLHHLVSAQLAWNLNQGDKKITRYYPQFFEWVESNQAIPSNGKTGLDNFHVPVWYKDLKDYNFKCVFKWTNGLYCWKLQIFTAYNKIETSQKDLRRFHTSKSNICFDLHFSPTSRWPRKISWALSTSSAWMKAIWGTVISSHSSTVYYFCEYGLQLDTQSLKTPVSCVECLSYEWLPGIKKIFD